MQFFISYDYIFYWFWLGILVVRQLLNYRVYTMRGDITMKAYGSKTTPDYEANIMTLFTFHFDADPSDSPSLVKLVRYTNMLHHFFIVYCVLVFLLFIFTFGKS